MKERPALERTMRGALAIIILLGLGATACKFSSILSDLNINALSFSGGKELRDKQTDKQHPQNARFEITP